MFRVKVKAAMPALSNNKHEQFAQAIAKGVSATGRKKALSGHRQIHPPLTPAQIPSIVLQPSGSNAAEAQKLPDVTEVSSES